MVLLYRKRSAECVGCECMLVCFIFRSKRMTLRDGPSLSNQPIQSLLPALPLQLSTKRLTAQTMVIIQPVSLQENKNYT